MFDEESFPAYIDTIKLWPNQLYAVDAVVTEIAKGTRRILVTGPTGSGKTLVMAKVAQAALAEDWGVNLFANRKLLVEQMGKAMKKYELGHSYRAANHDSNRYARFQVCSIQTEYSRVVKRETWGIHDCRLILIDEAHLMEPPTYQRVWKKYADAGAFKVGFTATPLDLDGCYDVLIQAGTVSELIGYGALVPALHFGCSEPDLKNIRRVPVGEDLTEDEQRKVMMVPGIHGRVIEKWRELNPHGLPTLGFAPGVPESVGFAQAFEKAGIPAAHIDGERLWVRGEEILSTEQSRDRLLEMSRTGEVRVVWNRFVLREAVDMPWLRHGILATVFGSLQSYLQSGGRLLRACKDVGKRHVTVQDHGGNWWRHGSLNADRHWRLTDTNRALAMDRENAIAGNDGEPTEPEPFLCPRCGAVVKLRGPVVGSRCHCANCGYEFDFSRRSRPVIQASGELVMHDGPIFRKKVVERRPDTQQKWERMYWRAKNSNMNFNQAVGLFFQEHKYWPPRDLPYMPCETIDWHLPVKNVPLARLRPKG